MGDNTAGPEGFVQTARNRLKTKTLSCWGADGWVGFDDKQISLGKENGARAALPIWLEFMQGAVAGTPPMDFPNVVPLKQQAGEHHRGVDTRIPPPPKTSPPPPQVKRLPALIWSARLHRLQCLTRGKTQLV